MIDTFLSMPDTRARQAAKYQTIRDLSNDRETKSMEMPAEYMFKGVPHYEDDEVEDPIQVVLAGMEASTASRSSSSACTRTSTASGPCASTPTASPGCSTSTRTRAWRRCARSTPPSRSGASRSRAVHCWGTGLIPQVPVGDKMMYPIYAKCVEVGLPIIVYAGVPGPRIPAMAAAPDAARRGVLVLPRAHDRDPPRRRAVDRADGQAAPQVARACTTRRARSRRSTTPGTSSTSPTPGAPTR